MATNPLAEPYLDDIQGAAAWARSTLVQDNYGDDVIPGRFEPYESIPPELIESLVDLETGGTWNPSLVNPASGATGLGQVMPGGGSQEVAWFQQLTGDDVSDQDLNDPRINLRLVAFGLGARWSQVKSIAPKTENMYLAGAGWFGCLPGKDGQLDPSCGDGNMTGDQYMATLDDYVREWYGDEAADDIGDLPGTDLTRRSRNLPNEARDAVLGPLFDLAERYAVPAVAIMGGIVVLTFGVAVIMRG